MGERVIRKRDDRGTPAVPRGSLSEPYPKENKQARKGRDDVPEKVHELGKQWLMKYGSILGRELQGRGNTN